MWGYDWFGDPRTVDVHIAQVRKKIGDAVRDQDGARRRLPARVGPVTHGPMICGPDDPADPSPADPPARGDGRDRVRHARRRRRGRRGDRQADRVRLRARATCAAARPSSRTLVDNLGNQIRNQPVTAAAANRLQDTIVELLSASGTSVFTINADGTVTQGASGLIGREPASGADTTLLDLPEDLRLNDLDLVELVAGKTQDGVDGVACLRRDAAHAGRRRDAGGGRDPAGRATAARPRRHRSSSSPAGSRCSRPRS